MEITSAGIISKIFPVHSNLRLIECLQLFIFCGGLQIELLIYNSRFYFIDLKLSNISSVSEHCCRIPQMKKMSSFQQNIDRKMLNLERTFVYRSKSRCQLVLRIYHFSVCNGHGCGCSHEPCSYKNLALFENKQFEKYFHLKQMKFCGSPSTGQLTDKQKCKPFQAIVIGLYFLRFYRVQKQEH